MLKGIILLVFITTALADSDPYKKTIWWDTDDLNEYKDKGHRVPFPECLLSGSKQNYLESSSLGDLFNKALRAEEKSLMNERYENKKHNYDDLMDYDADGSRKDYGKSRQAATAAVKLTQDIMTVLACDLNGTDAKNLDHFLQKFKMPEEFCKYHEKPKCDDRKKYRTPTGICNNLERPYEGSSQTAYARIITADYDDHLSKPRRKAYGYGLLPSCRQVSLAFGSKPIFSREYNNFFAVFGQFIGHDISLATPATDTYLTPISSCTCGSKYDWNKCTVIDIKPDDPYLRGQKCMAFPATAQAFKNQICSLGVKEQMNGNTHIPDLSVLYGNTVRTAAIVRSDQGLLKSTRTHWSKLEMPPAQREGKSCVDATYKQPCFAGGDSRLMVTLGFTSVQTIFLRKHNELARALHDLNPHWSNDKLYEEARKINIAFFQDILYTRWLPLLFGTDEFKELFGPIGESSYNVNIPPVVFNEVAAAAFRLHTLVRDLFSRCTPDGNRIDELWLHDISAKAKYAYDMENNGLDSIICGLFYDYGFAHDGNFAHQIHNRLFESVNKYGQLWRNDLVAINICRGREHGIRGYNAYREYCKLPKAYNFEDFGDTINYDGIQFLKKNYGHPEDVDLFVGLNLEDTLPGSLIGPVSACLLSLQFKALRDGDRLFYSHPGVFTPGQLQTIVDYPFHCFICSVVDIDKVPLNPFKPPNDSDNVLKSCRECANFDLSDWAETQSA
ncbi:unnamed protein product [Adineta ricciae]|uniref:Uncharacterized protein n=2 Tax=Adineta ricciae TaxID=249248 RepID=A0A814FBY3_ADIRI|nr:unnamed protein product [Adineta ricciae]